MLFWVSVSAMWPMSSVLDFSDHTSQCFVSRFQLVDGCSFTRYCTFAMTCFAISSSRPFKVSIEQGIELATVVVAPVGSPRVPSAPLFFRMFTRCCLTSVGMEFITYAILVNDCVNGWDVADSAAAVFPVVLANHQHR